MICQLLSFFSISKWLVLLKMMDGMKERNSKAQFTGKFISKPAQDVTIIAFKAIINLALLHIMAS